MHERKFYSIELLIWILQKGKGKQVEIGKVVLKGAKG